MKQEGESEKKENEIRGNGKKGRKQGGARGKRTGERKEKWRGPKEEIHKERTTERKATMGG